MLAPDTGKGTDDDEEDVREEEVARHVEVLRWGIEVVLMPTVSKR